MKSTIVLGYIWKLLLCSLGCILGMLFSGASLHALGFLTLALPAGINAGVFTIWFLLGSMLLAFGLSFVSSSLKLNWLARWVILEELVWVLWMTGLVLSSFLFTKPGTISSLVSGLYTMLHFLLPSLFLTVLVAILFRSKVTKEIIHVPDIIRPAHPENV
jgi:hypothetical protein